jgi:hypothetical protein
MNRKIVRPNPSSESRDDGEDPVSDAAVREILDHMAEELAREYVRLMEKAANQENRDDVELGRKEES